MKSSIKYLKLLILVFVLSLAFFSYKTSYSIYSETLNAPITLTVLDPSTTYNVTFKYNNGDPDSIGYYTYNQAFGNVTAPVKPGYNFVGWYTDNNVKYGPTTPITGDVTLNATYVKIVCKKAVQETLHKETCSQSSTSYGCRGAGYGQDTQITYGTIAGATTRVAGNAYDCDVNNDDVYDPDTERFYLVKENASDDTISLIYYTSIDEDGVVDTSVRQGGSYYYTESLAFLPPYASSPASSDDWDNPALTHFDDKAARYITIDEVTNACGTLGDEVGYLDNCIYLMENSRFQSNDLGRAGIWIQKESNSGNSGYRMHTQNRLVASVNTTSTSNGSNNTSRPVIVIPVNTIDGYQDRNQYQIRFVVGNGSAVSPITKYETQQIGSLPTSTQEGYRFDGWYYENNYQTEFDPTDIMPSHDVYLYAKWDEIIDNMEYVFRLPGTCEFHGKPTAQANNYITSPDDSCVSTDKLGNQTDWGANNSNYIDTGISLFSTTNASKDFEVGFTIVSYNSSGQSSDQATFVNSKLENSTLNYPGFVVRRSGSNIALTEKFNGVTGDHNFTYAAGKRIRIVRKESKIWYAENDDDLTELQNISSFDQFFELHTWFGAISKATSTSATGVGSTADRHLTATLSNMYIKLEVDQQGTHQVRFITEGGTMDMPSTRYVSDGAQVGTLPTVTRDHYTFDGWYDENDQLINATYVITEDTDFHAVFTPVQHTISFDTHGGTAVADITRAFNTQVGTISAVTTKEHYTFAGWYTDENYNEQVTPQTLVTGDTTYHAAWTPAQHTITLNVMGGDSMLPLTYAYGSTVGNLPAATKTNFTFGGWYFDSECTQPVTPQTVVTADDEYFARWLTGNPYTISFNSQDGSYVPTIYKGYGEALGQLTEPTKPYHVFEGWYSDSDLTNAVDENTLVYSDMTLYAKWAIDPIYVAAIGDSYYETLPAAFAAVTTSEQKTIRLLQDTTITSAIVTSATQNIIMEGGNYSVTNSNGTIFENYGTLEIASGSYTTSGGGEKIAIINRPGGHLILSGGTVHSTVYNVIANNGTFDMTGGTVTIGNVTQGIVNNNAGATFNVYGGSIIASVAGSKRQAIYNTKGTVNIYGGTFSSKSTDRATVQNDSTGSVINIYGGTIESLNANCQRGAVQNGAGNTLRITGGTITSASTNANSGGVQNAGTLIIGTEDGLYDATSPVIQGKKYGVNTSTNISMYDGILKGVSGAINDQSYIPTANTEAGMEPVDSGTETIEGSTYHTLYYQLIDGIKVNLDPGQGSVYPTFVVVAENAAVGDLPVPERSGYAFDGWYDSNSQLVTSSTTVTAETTYTARWVLSVASATITNSTMTLNVNGTETINVTNSASIEEYTYSSNDTSVATVSSSGLVTAVGPGKTQIVLTGDLSGDITHVLVTSNISNDIQTFDIMSPAMRTYFNNIDIWAKDQTDDSHASYDAAINSTLSTYNCINFSGDNRQIKSSATGSTFCDVPNKYDTGVSGTINVSEYNPSTNSIIGPASYVSVSDGKIYNVIPGKTYYWESAADSSVNGKFYAYGERRTIQIDNLKAGSSDTYFQTRNVRDLGGITVTYDAGNNTTVRGKIKYGKLFRGEKIWGGNGDSLQYFTKLGINHEMDLRGNSEPVAAEEDAFAEANKIVTASGYKTYEVIHYGIDYSKNRSNYDLARAAVIEVMDAFINAEANNQDYSLYFHCRIGADRTGMMAYLLEGLLGVSEEDRYRDYEMTVFFGLDERTRFYYNKDTNTTKFVYMKEAIRNASTNNTEDVVQWFLKGSSNTASDMAKIQAFRNAMIDASS